MSPRRTAISVLLHSRQARISVVVFRTGSVPGPSVIVDPAGHLSPRHPAPDRGRRYGAVGDGALQYVDDTSPHSEATSAGTSPGQGKGSPPARVMLHAPAPDRVK